MIQTTVSPKEVIHHERVVSPGRAIDCRLSAAMAKHIVAVLEVVNVNIGAGERFAFAPELIDVAVESAAVAQIGERVDIGAALKQLALLMQNGVRLEQTRTGLIEATSDGKAPMIASFSFGCSRVDPLAGDTRRQMTMEADRVPTRR